MMHREHERQKFDISSNLSQITTQETPNPNKLNIISPHVNIRGKYESSDSERSIPDFSDLCEDKPKKKKVISEPKVSKGLLPHETGLASKTGGARGKKFIVSFGMKDGHQWDKYNHGTQSIYINDRNGPVLHLYRGTTYYFCIDSKSDGVNFFFLTDSPAGGLGSKPITGGFAPISKGCVKFEVTKYTPRYLFYQSSRNMFEGGLIIVHDNQPTRLNASNV